MPKLRKRSQSKVKPKAKSISWWIKKCDQEMSKLVRKKERCEWCGSTNSLQHAHVIGRTNKTLRYDILNALCLCYACHFYKWHRSPLEAMEWFKLTFPNRYDYLMRSRNEVSDRTVEDYKKILEDIKLGNIRSLVFGIVTSA